MYKRQGSFERKGHFEDRKGNGIAVTVPKGEVDKATGIALQIEGDGKAKRCTIPDELDELRELQETDFTLMSPISYFGRRRCGKNARYLYAPVSYTHLDVYKRQRWGPGIRPRKAPVTL